MLRNSIRISTTEMCLVCVSIMCICNNQITICTIIKGWKDLYCFNQVGFFCSVIQRFRKSGFKLLLWYCFCSCASKISASSEVGLHALEAPSINGLSELAPSNKVRASVLRWNKPMKYMIQVSLHSFPTHTNSGSSKIMHVSKEFRREGGTPG